MAEDLECPGNPATRDGAKENLSGLTAIFSQIEREEIQDVQGPELGPEPSVAHLGV